MIANTGVTAESSARTIDVLLEEGRVFDPSAAFVAQANISDPSIYERARRDPEAFWEGFARELHWYRKWEKVLDWQPPNARWFVGGQTNISYNDALFSNGFFLCLIV